MLSLSLCIFDLSHLSSHVSGSGWASPGAPVEEFLLAALHVSPVEILVQRVVTLAGQPAPSDLQRLDLPEVGGGHRDVRHVLEVEEAHTGLDVCPVKSDRALLTPRLSEEHLHRAGDVRQAPPDLRIQDVGKDEVCVRLSEASEKCRVRRGLRLITV